MLIAFAVGEAVWCVRRAI